MFLKSLIMKQLVILFLLICFCSFVFAQVQGTQQPTPQANPPAEPVKSVPALPQVDLSQRKGEQKLPECACLKPGVDSIQKAYASLEEDEWPNAIKTCKDTIDAIKILSKTCKCPEVAVYQKVAEAYLKYAEGGNHLDGADEPNCTYALKLYDEAISSLKGALPKITNAQVKENANSIWEYAVEEQQFVQDECKGSQPTPAKEPPPKQSGQAGAAKQ